MAIIVYTFDKPVVVLDPHHLDVEGILLFNKHDEVNIPPDQKRDITPRGFDRDKRLKLKTFTVPRGEVDETVGEIELVQVLSGKHGEREAIEGEHVLDRTPVNESSDMVPIVFDRGNRFELMKLVRYKPTSGDMFHAPAERAISYLIPLEVVA